MNDSCPPQIEALEARRLFAADLSLTFDPGTTGVGPPVIVNRPDDWSLLITNVGDEQAVGTARLDATAAFPPTIPATTIVVETVALNLAPGETRRVFLDDSSSQNEDGFLGEIQLSFALIPLTVADFDPANNNVAAFSVQTAMAFGAMDGRNFVARWTDLSAFTTHTLRLTGGGEGLVQKNPVTLAYDVTTTGTTEFSVLRATGPAVASYTLHADASLKSVLLPASNIGDVTVAGALGTLRASGIFGGTFSIGAASGPLQVTQIFTRFGVANTSMTSLMPLSMFSKSGMLDSDMTAPRIDRLKLIDVGRSTITLTDTTALLSARNIYVKGFAESVFRAPGSVQFMSCQYVVDSSILVGVTDPAVGINATISQLTPGVSVGKFVMRRAVSGARWFRRSSLVSTSFGLLHLRNVEDDGLSPPSGVTADAVGFYRRIGPPNVLLRNLDAAGVVDAVGLFRVAML
jgi:hypothetical protein